jgi:hypothetical protein
MDAQELRNLQEAYNQVYQVDETIRNPESRKKLRAIMDKEVVKGDKSKGQNPRKKYHTKTGDQAFSLLMKRDETGSKGNPVRKRGGTNAPPEERVGKGPNRAKNAAYWAGNAGPTRDRGAGNKAARRAGKSVANTRDFDENYDIYDIILSHLLDEGYAETPEAAEAIMVNMSEEWRESIMISEGMTMKDFKANRQKNKRRAASADAEKRGHVGKEWYNSGRKYSPDEAKHNRAKMDDEERRTRHRSAVDPDDEDDNNYSADKTKNPKKLRKQKAMGELG